jgi:multiple sugar transport system permease protein
MTAVSPHAGSLPTLRHGSRPAAQTARTRNPLQRQRARVGRFLVLPAVFIVLAFFVAPFCFALYISLTNWPLVGRYHFIGLSNYGALAHNALFLHALLFTVEYTVIVVPLVFVVGYAQALLVRRKRRGSTLLRTIFFLPYVVGLATESFMMILELQPASGALDFLFNKAGLASANTAWLVTPGLGLAVVCAIVVWYASGLTMVILMGGMQAIPKELYEAAGVDGAGWWTRELRVTLPLLRKPAALALTISTIGSLLAFTQFYVLTQGGPGTSTETIVMWIYETAFTYLHVGLASAMSVVLLVVVAAVSVVELFLMWERKP